MSDVPGWAIALGVICVLLGVSVVCLSVALALTARKLRKLNRKGARSSGSGEEGDADTIVPRRQTSTRTALTSISRVFTNVPGPGDRDVEARSPMMAGMGVHTWNSPPQPAVRRSGEIPNPFPHMRPALDSSSNEDSSSNKLPAPRRVRGPRQQPRVMGTEFSETQSAEGVVSRSSSDASSKLATSSSRSAVTPVTALYQPRPSMSVDTTISNASTNTGRIEWRPMPLVFDGQKLQAMNRGPASASSSAPPSGKMLTPRIDTSPRGDGEHSVDATVDLSYSPDSIYPETAYGDSPRSFIFKQHEDGQDVPPVPPLPLNIEQIQSKLAAFEATHHSRPENSRVGTESWRKARGTFGSFGDGTPTCALSPQDGGRVSRIPTQKRVPKPLKSTDPAFPPPASPLPKTPGSAKSRGHHRGLSLDEYSSPAVEMTTEYDEENMVAPMSGRSMKFVSNTIDRVLATVAEREQEEAPIPHDGVSLGHERSISTSTVRSDLSADSGSTLLGHRRTESGWSTNNSTAPSLAMSSIAEADRTPSCVSIRSTYSSSAETSFNINTPKSSMFEFDMTSPDRSKALNSYTHPTPTQFIPASSLAPNSETTTAPTLNISSDPDEGSYIRDSDVATMALLAASNRHCSLPSGALPFFLPKMPRPPSHLPDMPGTPVSITSGGDESSWGTDPGTERAILERLIALQRSSLAPLNTSALDSLTSVQSAVPSTPGGPDLNPPTPEASFAHRLSHQASLRSLVAASEAARLAAAAAARKSTHPNHDLSRLHPLHIQSSEHLSTPQNVQPPDWDITMWTRANVDGTL